MICDLGSLGIVEEQMYRGFLWDVVSGSLLGVRSKNLKPRIVEWFHRFGLEISHCILNRRARLDRSRYHMNEVRNTGDETLIDRFAATLHFSPSGGGWTPIDGVAMSSKLEGTQKDLAWKAMKFIAGEETKTWDFEQRGPKPVTHLVGPELYPENDPYLVKNDEVAGLAKAAGYEINPFFVSNMQPAIAGIMSRAINGEDVDVEAEMQDMQAKAVEWSAAQ